MNNYYKLKIQSRYYAERLIWLFVALDSKFIQLLIFSQEDSEVDSMEGDHHANKIPPLDLKTSNVPAPVRLPVVGDEWEILEGLRNGQLCNDAPNKFCGYMMKSRKWPMKGWHKVCQL